MVEVVKRIHKEDASQSFPSNDPPVEVIEKDNNNTTSPTANQTSKVNVPIVPPAQPVPKPRAPKADEEVTVLGWVRKKRGPLA